MPAFQTSVDIANRALDHCGQGPLDATLGFAENSIKASLTARVYPKLREAELRRNTWRFAIRHAVLRAIDVNTMLLAPSLWVSTTTYFVGSIVAYADRLWISMIPSNLANQPETSAAWQEYFGPMSVMLWVSTTTYAAGELVYTTPGNGTYRVFISLQTGNADNPATATAWSATAVYFKNQVVTSAAIAYMSRIDFNTNQTPASSPANWNVATTYGAAATVTGSDGVIYSSIAGGNVGNDPTLSPALWTNTGVLTPWTTVFTGGTGSLKWLEIGGASFPFGVGLTTLNIVYPLNAGPSSESTTRNVFRLPSGFLRKAAQDPRAGSVSYLGAAWGPTYDDWNFEGNYIVSAQVSPIVLRFVADTVDVANMDPMFCEGLGACIGMHICEPLTQSAQKIKVIADFYKLQMGEARTVNAVEIGSEEPAVDDYISCRG